MSDSLGNMDAATALQLMILSASLLGLIITLLLLYMVIRLGVSHALRSHHYWKLKQQRP